MLFRKAVLFLRALFKKAVLYLRALFRKVVVVRALLVIRTPFWRAHYQIIS